MSPIEILEAMQGKHIAVVGDPLVDKYVFGRVERVCPEAPVPVFIPEREERRQGGAANVSTQVNALGCRAISLMPGNVSVKTRYMAGHHLLLRVDSDVSYSPGKHEVAAVVEGIRDANAVVLSDYAHGWLSYDMVRAVIGEAKACGVPVIADPKKRYSHMKGVDLLCPTEDEFGVHFEEDFTRVLIKRGAKGLRLQVPYETYDIPAVARAVFDVTGAGDVVVAVTAAAVSAGATYFEAAKLANLAAGWSVGQVGTVSCSLETLAELVNAS
jgi:rfaE bifunctional protein kinase chain/domain